GFGLPELPYDEAVTGADGKFRLDGIPPLTEVNVKASLSGRVPQYADWTADKPRRFEFRMVPSGAIRGIVRDGDGKPVEGASVECRCGSARTHEDGTYEITGLPLDEAYDVWAEDGNPEQRASAPARGVRITIEVPIAVQDLALLKPAKLTLRVHDPDGAAVGDAEARLECASFSVSPAGKWPEGD